MRHVRRSMVIGSLAATAAVFAAGAFGARRQQRPGRDPCLRQLLRRGMHPRLHGVPHRRGPARRLADRGQSSTGTPFGPSGPEWLQGRNRRPGRAAQGPCGADPSHGADGRHRRDWPIRPCGDRGRLVPPALRGRRGRRRQRPTGLRVPRGRPRRRHRASGPSGAQVPGRHRPAGWGEHRYRRRDVRRLARYLRLHRTGRCGEPGANGGRCLVRRVAAGTLSEFTAGSRRRPPTPFVFTLYVNGAATGITCSIAGGSSACTDSANTAALAAGDTVAVGITRRVAYPLPPRELVCDPSDAVDERARREPRTHPQRAVQGGRHGRRGRRRRCSVDPCGRRGMGAAASGIRIRRTAPRISPMPPTFPSSAPSSASTRLEHARYPCG